MARKIVKAFATVSLQIVVPLDKRPARSLRQVTKLEVRDVK